MSYLQKDLPSLARGDTWALKFVIQDNNGNPINIAGNQYWFTLKSNIDSSDLQAELQAGPFVAQGLDAQNGILTLTINPSLTDSLEAKTYNYDLQEVEFDGTVSTLVIGKVKVRKDITRSAEYESSGGTSIITSSRSGTAIYAGQTNSTEFQEIYLDGVVGNRLTLESEGVLAFNGLVTGKDLATLSSCAFEIYGAIEKDSETTKIIGSVGKNILGQEHPDFDVEVLTDSADNSLVLKVKSFTVSTTRWSAKLEFTEVVF